MKKIMFALVAAGAAAVMADGIESANVVGYNNKKPAVAENYYMMVSCFQAIGTNGVSLADLKVSGYPAYDSGSGEGGSSGAIKITELKANGAADRITVGGDVLPKIYWWMDFGSDAPAGWYDENAMMMADAATATAAGFEQSPFGDAKNIFFKTGYGFRVIRDSNYPDAVLTFSGDVKQTDTLVKPEIAEFFYSSGNATADSITLADLTVEGYSAYNPDSGEGGSSGAIKITQLKANGSADRITVGGDVLPKIYWWMDFGVDAPAGWYDENAMMMADLATATAAGFEQSPFGDAKDITFQPGDGFRLIRDSNYDNAQLRIPAPAAFTE